MDLLRIDFENTIVYVICIHSYCYCTECTHYKSIYVYRYGDYMTCIHRTRGQVRAAELRRSSSFIPHLCGLGIG